MALDGILSARNAKLTPRANIIINNIKNSLLNVVKYKPKSTITECIKSIKPNKGLKLRLHTTLNLKTKPSINHWV